jgi:hypothetical protein
VWRLFSRWRGNGPDGYLGAVFELLG